MELQAIESTEISCFPPLQALPGSLRLHSQRTERFLFVFSASPLQNTNAYIREKANTAIIGEYSKIKEVEQPSIPKALACIVHGHKELFFLFLLLFCRRGAVSSHQRISSSFFFKAFLLKNQYFSLSLPILPL